MGADANKHHQTLLDIQERAQQAPSDNETSDAGPEREVEDSEDIFFAGISSNGPTNDNLPESLDEVLRRPDCLQWKSVLNKELQNLSKNDVYEVVPIPKGAVPITSKPVFQLKFDKNGNIEHYKMHIVARGFMQREGIDYNETFAPVANLESIRIICALAARYDLELDQMDVSTAYLNGELLEELYLLPPKGVSIIKGHCWRLKKSLYGLKQAGRTWNRTLDKKLIELNFTRLNAETCLYVCREGSDICFLVVYVDDLLLAASSSRFMSKVKEKLSHTFRMRDLGAASYILGIKVERDRK